MAWRQFHPLEGVNALCLALGDFAEVAVAEDGRRTTDNAYLSDLLHRPVFKRIPYSDDRPIDYFRRTMPAAFRLRCIAVLRVMIRKMELSPLHLGTMGMPLKLICAETGETHHSVKRAILAMREAGIIKRTRRGVKGKWAMHTLSEKFRACFSRRLKKLLAEDWQWIQKKRQRAAERKEFALTQPPAAAPELPMQPAAEKPPPDSGGFWKIGDVFNKWRGK